MSSTRSAPKRSVQSRSMSAMIPVGQADDLRAPVARVGHALGVAQALEVADRLADPLLGHARELGELGQAHAVLGDVPEDTAVRLAHVAVARLFHARQQLRDHRVGGRVQQRHEVRAPGAPRLGCRRHLVSLSDKVA